MAGRVAPEPQVNIVVQRTPTVSFGGAVDGNAKAGKSGGDQGLQAAPSMKKKSKGTINFRSARPGVTRILTSDPLFAACRDGDLEQLEKIAQEIIGVDASGGEIRIGSRTRDHDGGTILHVATLFGQEKLVKWICETFPDLVNQGYEQMQYLGQTALHMAAVEGNIDLVNILLSHGAKTNGTVAYGFEFLMEQHGGSMYYGQTVLQFAACSNDIDIVRTIIEAGAQIDAVDDYGNNVLHILAYHGKFEPELFEYVKKVNVRLLKEGKVSIEINTQRNKEGMTPFQVGISRGHARMIDTLKEPIWQLGHLTHYRIPIEDLDPIHKRADGEPTKSALEIGVYLQSTEIIAHPVMKSLLHVKWILYCRRKFLVSLVRAVIQAACLTASMTLLPSTIAQRADYSSCQTIYTYSVRTYQGTVQNGLIGTDYSCMRLIFETIALAGACLQLLLGATDTLLNSFKSSQREQSLMQILYGLGIWIIVCIRFILAPHFSSEVSQFLLLDAENVLWGLCAMMLWMHILNFGKGFFQLGPLLLMTRKMVINDLLVWLCLYFSFTAGTACILYLQMNDVSQISVIQNAVAAATNTTGPAIVEDWMYVTGAFTWTVRFLFSQSSYDDFRKSKFPFFTELVFILYSFFIAILLLNMLIGMFANTLTLISQMSKKAWLVQWASLILDMDKRLFELERQLIHAHLGVSLSVSDPTAFRSGEGTARYFIYIARKERDDGVEVIGGNVSTASAVQDETVKLIIALDRDGEEEHDVEINMSRDLWSGVWRDFGRGARSHRPWFGHPHRMNHVHQVSSEGVKRMRERSMAAAGSRLSETNNDGSFPGQSSGSMFNVRNWFRWRRKDKTSVVPSKAWEDA